MPKQKYLTSLEWDPSPPSDWQTRGMGCLMGMYTSSRKDQTASKVSSAPGNWLYCGFQLFGHKLKMVFLAPLIFQNLLSLSVAQHCHVIGLLCCCSTKLYCLCVTGWFHVFETCPVPLSSSFSSSWLLTNTPYLRFLPNTWRAKRKVAFSQGLYFVAGLYLFVLTTHPTIIGLSKAQLLIDDQFYLPVNIVCFAFLSFQDQLM